MPLWGRSCGDVLPWHKMVLGLPQLAPLSREIHLGGLRWMSAVHVPPLTDTATPPGPKRFPP